METQDQQVLYNKESNLGVTTFTFRSKRYSFPSVIVKSDIQTEGVCVMLDVGLFCPFCSGNFKSKYMHKRSHLSISQKRPGSTGPGGGTQLTQRPRHLTQPRTDSSTGAPQKLQSQSSFTEYHEGHSESHEGSKHRTKLLDKSVLVKPDLSILDELKIKTEETLIEDNGRPDSTRRGDSVSNSAQTRGFEAESPITEPNVMQKVGGTAHSGVKSVQSEAGRRAFPIEDNVGTRERDVIGTYYGGQTRDMPQRSNQYVPRADREKKLLTQDHVTKSPTSQMASPPRGVLPNTEHQHTVCVEPLTVLAASVLNAEDENTKSDLKGQGSLINDRGVLSKQEVNQVNDSHRNAVDRSEWICGPGRVQVKNEEDTSCKQAVYTECRPRVFQGRESREKDHKQDHEPRMALRSVKSNNPEPSEDSGSVSIGGSVLCASGSVSVASSLVGDHTFKTEHKDTSRPVCEVSLDREPGDRDAPRVVNTDTLDTGQSTERHTRSAGRAGVERASVQGREYFEELLRGGSTAYHHSQDRLYSYEESSSGASSLVHSADDAVWLQPGSSRDTLLTEDALLTDDVTSEEESYRHVDEHTLRTIENKLLENLAKLELCENQLDEERRTGESEIVRSQGPPAVYEAGTLGTVGDKTSFKKNCPSAPSEKVSIGGGVSPAPSSVYQQHRGVQSEVRGWPLLDTVCSTDSGAAVPSGKEMYERAFDLLVEGEGEGVGVEIPTQEMTSTQAQGGHRGCCRSYSPEVMMEQILDELQDDSETFSADATLGRVFSIRREKFVKPVRDSNVPLNDSEDIGEIYQFMKNLNNNMCDVKEHNGKRSDNQEEDLKELNVGYSSTMKSASLNDLLDDEISCAKDLNETFSTVERGTSLTQRIDSINRDLSETLTTLNDSVFLRSSPNYEKPMEIDEIFENAFEHALEGAEDKNVINSTSDYESDVKGSNNTSKTASLETHPPNVCEQYLKRLELSNNNKSNQTSSIECIMNDGSNSKSCTSNAPLSNEAMIVRSVSSEIESDSQLRMPVKYVVEQIDGLTHGNGATSVERNQKSNDVGDTKSYLNTTLVHDELNVETQFAHTVCAQEGSFHTPDSVCAPRSPTIVKPQVSLAKMQKIPRISDEDCLNEGEIIVKEPAVFQRPVFGEHPSVTKLYQFYRCPTESGPIPPFGRQLSMDEMSEGSTMSSIDEFIPETEEYKAPPEVLEEAYYAAIEVAQMFQQHHIKHPCFQKIIEEISSSRESLVKSEGESSRSNTLKWKSFPKQSGSGEKLTKQEGQDNRANICEENKALDHVAVVTSDGDKQNFLQQLFGPSHTEHKQKHKDIQEICRSCEIKTDDDVIVKSEEVSTQEVTLVFAWPKRKGKVLPLTSNPYRELHMHRVMNVSDLDVEIIEGPTMKSIAQVPKDQKSIAPSDVSTETISATQSTQSPDMDAVSRCKGNIVQEKTNSCDENIKDSNFMCPIIADVDVKVKTTRFEPQEHTLLIERQTSSEKKTVENITDNIIRVLSKNNTVEVNENDQLSLQDRKYESSNSLQDIMLQCTAEDISLYAETFFDLVFHDAIDVAAVILTSNEHKYPNNKSGSSHFLDNPEQIKMPMYPDCITSPSDEDLPVEYQNVLDYEASGLYNVPQLLETEVKDSSGCHLTSNVHDSFDQTTDATGGEIMSNSEDVMSQLALDILENTPEKAAAATNNAEGNEYNDRQMQISCITTHPEQQLQTINIDPREQFRQGGMYSSLQDLGSISKPKDGRKRLSLSETLHENTEIEVRKATSLDEITGIIDSCVLTLETSLRTSGELPLGSQVVEKDDDDIDDKILQDSDYFQVTPSLGTIHEGTTKISKNYPPPVKPKPKADNMLLSSKVKRKEMYPTLVVDKVPPPVKPKPNVHLKDMVRCVSDDNVSCVILDNTPKLPTMMSPPLIVEKVKPPVKPKPRVDVKRFQRSVSEGNVSESSAEQPPKDPIPVHTKVGVSGLNKSPPVVKPKPFRHPDQMANTACMESEV